MIEAGYKGICSHCGTVARALTVWNQRDTADCPCLCHIPPPEPAVKMKRTPRRKK